MRFWSFEHLIICMCALISANLLTSSDRFANWIGWAILLYGIMITNWRCSDLQRSLQQQKP